MKTKARHIDQLNQPTAIVEMQLSKEGTEKVSHILQVASLAQLLPPRSPTGSNPAPDSSLCRAAAP